jgi:hypothetical protein
MGGDLWTAEEGHSDLVLDAYVYEVDEAFEVELNAVLRAVEPVAMERPLGDCKGA